jgi:hypothetical protein
LPCRYKLKKTWSWWELFKTIKARCWNGTFQASAEAKNVL